jgi:hypothetical protein
MKGDLADKVEMHDVRVLYSVVKEGESVVLPTRKPSTAHIDLILPTSCKLILTKTSHREVFELSLISQAAKW